MSQHYSAQKCSVGPQSLTVCHTYNGLKANSSTAPSKCEECLYWHCLGVTPSFSTSECGLVCGGGGGGGGGGSGASSNSQANNYGVCISQADSVVPPGSNGNGNDNGNGNGNGDGGSSSSSSSSSAAGAAAGAVIGVLALIAIVVAAVIYYRRRTASQRSHRLLMKRSAVDVQRGDAHQGAAGLPDAKMHMNMMAMNADNMRNSLIFDDFQREIESELPAVNESATEEFGFGDS